MNSKALVSCADMARRSSGKKEKSADQNSQQISRIKDLHLTLKNVWLKADGCAAER